MNKRHLVDSLSLSRIIFGILFACSVFYLNGNLIIIFVIYLFAVLSDVLSDFAFIMLSSFALCYVNLLPFWFLIIITLKLMEFFKTSSEGLEYEKFGTLVALMFYALPGIIVLFNFFKIPIIINLMLCIFITVCAIISSGLRIIHKRRN